MTFEAPDRYYFDTDDVNTENDKSQPSVGAKSLFEASPFEDEMIHDISFRDKCDIDKGIKNTLDQGSSNPSTTQSKSLKQPESRVFTVSPGIRARMREILDRLWEENGLNVQMKPQDLALAVARIKIAWMEADDYVIGTIASEKVRSETDDADYFKRYRLFATKYSKKIGTVKRQFKDEHPECTEEELCKQLEKQIGTLQSRKYGKESHSNGYRLTARESKAHKLALQAGAKLQEAVCSALGDPHVDMKTLTMAQIELYSRKLSIYSDTPNGRMASTFALKRYLKKYLGKSTKELEDFAMLRSDYQIRLQRKSYHQKLRGNK